MDVVRGDPTLFMRRDEVEAAWAWAEPILRQWQESGAAHGCIRQARTDPSTPPPCSSGTVGAGTRGRHDRIPLLPT